MCEAYVGRGGDAVEGQVTEPKDLLLRFTIIILSRWEKKVRFIGSYEKHLCDVRNTQVSSGYVINPASLIIIIRNSLLEG
jgi:hypothetical protein